MLKIYFRFLKRLISSINSLFYDFVEIWYRINIIKLLITVIIFFVIVVVVVVVDVVVVDVEVVISIVNGSVTADSHNCPIEIL